MANGEFVWCDLSARRIDVACKFYGDLFNWRFQEEVTADGSVYATAYTSHAAAGNYTMPAKFAEMGMPCFWMSYIEVTSVEATIDKARSMGAIIELGPVDGPGDTKVALIRDPLGAGFTVIEGEGLSPRLAQAGHGDMAWNALYVSDSEAIIPFYEALFGWSISPPDVENSRRIDLAGRPVSEIHELPDNIRGKQQYWVVHFAVSNLTTARSSAESHGGVLYNDSQTVLAHDTDGAAFFLTEVNDH